MSLVHEALEKAKREASAKSAQELGLAESRVGAGQPFRARRRLHPGAAAALAAAVTLALAGGLFWWSRSKGEAHEAPPPRAPAPAALLPATSAASSAQVATAPQPTAAPIENSAPAESVVAPAALAASAAAPASETPATPTAAEPSPAPHSAALMPAAAATARSAPPSPLPANPVQRTAASAVPSLVRQTTLADGTILRLGGIAWSEEAPLAYLNGKLYGKGESVAGLFVEKIERERVLLSGERGRFYLTLR